MKNIILIGMRASGKSKIGKYIAKKLHREFVDTDDLIQEAEEMTVEQMVEKHGWEYFRELETEVCQNIGEETGLVISTGGGVPMRDENIEALKQNGYFVFLNVPIKDLAWRLEKSTHTHRPSLTGKSPVEELRVVWEDRKNRYFGVADVVFDSPNLSGDKKKDGEEHGRKLLKVLKNRKMI